MCIPSWHWNLQRYAYGYYFIINFLGLLRQVEDVVDGFGTLVYPIVNRTINLSSCKILLLLIIVLAGKVYIYICVRISHTSAFVSISICHVMSCDVMSYDVMSYDICVTMMQ